MSIILKGIDMPKCSNEDIMVVIRHDKAEVWQTGYKERIVETIQIPTPHGRLIDADEFTDVCEILADKGGDIRPWEQAEWIAKDMPTILEAER